MLVEGAELFLDQIEVVLELLQRQPVGVELPLEGLDRGEAAFCLLLLSTKGFPRLGRSVGCVFASKLAELVHLLPIVSNARVEFCHSSGRCIAFGDDFCIGGARSPCRCQKRFTFRSNTVDDIVALTAGDLAHRLVERLAKMVGGIPYRLDDVLRTALLNPQ